MSWIERKTSLQYGVFLFYPVFDSEVAQTRGERIYSELVELVEGLFSLASHDRIGVYDYTSWLFSRTIIWKFLCCTDLPIAG